MIPYDDFLLTDKQVNAIEKANAKSKIIEYIKKNGKEPENIESFYFATDEQIESVKRVVYADYLIQSKNSGNDNEEAVRVDFNFNKEDETFRGVFGAPLIDGYKKEAYTFFVLSKEADDEYTSYTPYAYGLFDNVEDASIILKTGYLYEFRVYYRPTNGTVTAYSDASNSWMNIQNRFILSNKGLRYFGNGDSELVNGYYGVVTDFNPKTDTTVKFQLKKVYGSITFVINNYIDEHVVIDVVGTGDYPALYLEGGGALPYDIKRVEENTNCTIDITNNVLTYTIPLSYNNQVSSYYGGRLSEAYEAANNGEDFSVDYPVSVSFKSSTSSSVPYIPVYSDTVSVKRGENVLIELDLNNIDSSTGFEFELEP